MKDLYEYTPEEVTALEAMGFIWDSTSQEWYNDKNVRQTPLADAIYKDILGDWILRTWSWNDEDAVNEEDYEHFNSLEELQAHLT